MSRKPYPSDVSDDERAFVTPYLTLTTKDALRRTHSLREAFNGLRWIVRTGAPWRLMPNNLSPWYTVYQQAQRWLWSGVFEAMVHDLCALPLVACGHNEPPSAVIIDSRSMQSSPESGGREGGRPRIPDRNVLTSIISVLCTGVPWEVLPQEMGCGSGMICWRRLVVRQRASDSYEPPHAAPL